MAVSAQEKVRILMKNPDVARAVLIAIKKCFSERLPAAKWFIHAGTALAAYYGRDKPDRGEVLPDDHDIDIGILAETCSEKDFDEAFVKNGFRRGGFFHDPDIKTIGAVLCYSKDGIPIDFFWMYKRGNKRWYEVGPKVPKVQPAYVFEDLRLVRFLGIEVPAPYPLEAYCHHRWKQVGDRFPDCAHGGQLLNILECWPIYDDQKKEVQATYEQQHGSG